MLCINFHAGLVLLAPGVQSVVKLNISPTFPFMYKLVHLRTEKLSLFNCITFSLFLPPAACSNFKLHQVYKPGLVISEEQLVIS